MFLGLDVVGFYYAVCFGLLVLVGVLILFVVCGNCVLICTDCSTGLFGVL